MFVFFVPVCFFFMMLSILIFISALLLMAVRSKSFLETPNYVLSVNTQFDIKDLWSIMMEQNMQIKIINSNEAKGLQHQRKYSKFVDKNIYSYLFERLDAGFLRVFSTNVVSFVALLMFSPRYVSSKRIHLPCKECNPSKTIKMPQILLCCKNVYIWMYF